jgi:hypothetical protein
MGAYAIVEFLSLAFAVLVGLSVFLFQQIYRERQCHAETMDGLDESRRLQVAAVSSEVFSRDAQIIKLKMSNRILNNNRELAATRANREAGARRAANKLVEVRTRSMQRMEVELRDLLERQGAITARVKALRSAAGVESGKSHALASQLLRDGSKYATDLQEIATAAKNTRQEARSLEVFASRVPINS